MSMTASALMAPAAVIDLTRPEILTVDDDSDEEEEDRKPSALLQRQQQVEEQAMMSDIPGIAFKFVERVIGTVAEARQTSSLLEHEASPVATDAMVYLAERLLQTHEEFNRQGDGSPLLVDIGFHYTKAENLTRIRTDGLLSRPERSAANIVSNFNGSVYGDGVYVANSPFGFHGKHYGNVGLIVARLKGVTRPAPAKFDTSFDSIIVRQGMWDEFSVLEKSYQCVPLVQFEAGLIEPSQPDALGNQAVFNLHIQLQRLVDDFFNNKRPTPVAPWQPSQSPSSATATRNYRKRARLNAASNPTGAMTATPASAFITNNNTNGTNLGMSSPSAVAAARALLVGGGTTPATAPVVVPPAAPVAVPPAAKRRRPIPQPKPAPSPPPAPPEVIQYQAPQTLPVPGDDCFVGLRCATHSLLSKDCVVCLDPLCRRGKIVKLLACGHHFHRNCISTSLQHSPYCPTCRKLIGKPQGKMPSGSMSISRIASPCAGFESAGTIVVKYNIASDTQKPYHPNPGTSHGSALRTAYLPDTDEGNRLLKRLKSAFESGLTFTVGTSLTSGRPDSVTWSSIHHKTNLHGGVRAHGFPDPDFFANCNLELDALHVPPADKLSDSPKDQSP